MEPDACTNRCESKANGVKSRLLHIKQTREQAHSDILDMGLSTFYRLRQRLSDEGGFTLIELLVVILIIGILAAIAIPSFLNQKSKATDASAKELVRSAQTASETYSIDHGGNYTGLNATELNKIEPTIQTTAGNVSAYLSLAESTESGTGYKVTATAASADKFSITRKSTGVIERTCEGTKGGCVNSTW
jgi:type IV pilus assembly protein PilA